jgi:hypothetical protein
MRKLGLVFVLMLAVLCAGPVLATTVQGNGTGSVNVLNTPTVNAGTGFPTPIPFPTLGVNVLNTPTVNAGTGFPTPIPTPVDPCGTAAATIPTAFVNQGVSTTIAIAHSASTSTYVCGGFIELHGSTASGYTQIITGTGTTCGSSTLALFQLDQMASGAINTAALPLGRHTYFSAGSGVDVCIITSGTGATTTATIWYKQQ